MATLARLRELPLRELAAHIDSRQHSPEKGNLSFPDPVLVCLNSCGPNREPLLRFGSRLARRLNRNWFAVHVQSLQESRVISGTEAQGALAESLALAQRLGATVFTFKGDDIVNTVLQFAREYRVGSIVVGRPRVRSCFLARQFGRLSIAERLMHESNAGTIVVFDAQTFPETAERKTAIPAAAHSGQHRIRNNRTHAAPMAGTWWNMPIMLWSTAIEKPVAMQDLLAACSCPRSSIFLRTKSSAWRAMVYGASACWPRHRSMRCARPSSRGLEPERWPTSGDRARGHAMPRS